MDTTGEGCGEKERWFSVNIGTQPSHVQDSNHVNNLNETLYNVNNNIMIVREFIIFCILKHHPGSPITIGNLIW